MEHGFEKTRNDFYSARSRTLARQESVWMGYDPTGRGSELVTERVHNFCSQTKRRKQPLERVPTGSRLPAGPKDLRVGIAADHCPSTAMGVAIAAVVGEVVKSGGVVVLPEWNTHSAQPSFGSKC